MKFTGNKNSYTEITERELEADTMPDSIYMGGDEKYLYYKCGTHKVKILKEELFGQKRGKI